MATLESWVEESKRRGEEVIVILSNKSTGEEVETTVSPEFIANIKVLTPPSTFDSGQG